MLDVVVLKTLSTRLVSAYRLDSMLAHHPGNTMRTASFALLTQVGKNPQVTVDTATCSGWSTNGDEQSLISIRANRQRLMHPYIEATARSTKHAAHRGHAVGARVLADKAVRHSGC
jgi:hypothetical protein